MCIFAAGETKSFQTPGFCPGSPFDTKGLAALARPGAGCYTAYMDALLDRITHDPALCGGRPCIRGLRIRVRDVLDLLEAGLSFEDILEELPALERDDIRASVAYASRRLDHPVINAAE